MKNTALETREHIQSGLVMLDSLQEACRERGFSDFGYEELSNFEKVIEYFYNRISDEVQPYLLNGDEQIGKLFNHYTLKLDNISRKLDAAIFSREADACLTLVPEKRLETIWKALDGEK